MEKNEKDWSGRHVRLRFELFITSLLISTFVFYHTELKPSALLPIDLSHIPQNIVLAVLYAFFIYTLIHFWIRTETERLGISQETAEINGALQNIISAKQNFDTSLGPLDPASVLDFLQILDGKISTLSESFAAESAAMSKYKRLYDRLEGARAAPDEANTTGMDESGKRRENIEELTIDVLQTEGKLASARSREDRAAEEHLRALRIHLKEMTEVMHTGAAQAVQNANKQLKMDVHVLNTIRRNFLLARNSFTWERMWASCYLPAGISTVLVVCSLTKLGYEAWLVR
ncbi:hypothetical protein [Pararhizobium sp. O133]|uniref:hypothetical protein n=1 Tax=Pararhizobium sp. O133 TaxID=3449278 RepID=UPI003F6867D0